MKLLTFAHLGEAQSFIKNEMFQKTNDPVNNFYKNKDSLLLITGEGIDSTEMKLSKLLSEYKNSISLVFNIGIAGVLDHSLKLESIHVIRKTYMEDEKNFFISTDTSATIDCITAKNRVMEKKYANQLSPIAPVVDRELWACAKTCYDFKIPFLSIKLISDYAGIATNSIQVIKRAKAYSEKLYKYYLQYI